MTALFMTGLSVLIADQTIKLMLRRVARGDGFAWGAEGGFRVVTARIWLTRLDCKYNRSITVMWCIWVIAAATLLVASTLASFGPVLVGLLLGGSLSQALETSIRGNITDCVCIRGWPAFNFADLALAAGAIGLIGELFVITWQMVA